MTAQRLVVACTGFNLVLLLAQVANHADSLSADARESPILRGRGLEIVDDHGQVRASIEILPPDSSITMPDGTVGSPATVLFRLRSSAGHPNVKIAATDDGAGLVLGGVATDTYLQLRARGATTMLKLSAEAKPPRVIVP